MNTEDKLKLIGICQKLVPIGAVELADDLEEIIDKQVAEKKVISDKEIDKTLKECLDDPVHGKMFRGLFLQVIKLQEKMKSQLETWGCPVCGAEDTQSKKKWEKDLAEDKAAGFRGLICGNMTCPGFWVKKDESSGI